MLLLGLKISFSLLQKFKTNQKYFPGQPNLQEKVETFH